MKPYFQFIRTPSGMSLLARSPSVLRSLSPKLPGYSVFYCYERLSSSSSGGADEPRSRDWVVLLSEVNLKRKFDDFRCAFKELRDSIQNIHPMGTPDWILLYEQEFDEQFEKFLSDYKQCKDNSLPKCGMQPRSDIDHPPPSPEEIEREKLEKQLNCHQSFLLGSNDRNDIIQSILYRINYEMRFVAVKYFRIISNMSTSDTMKDLKNLINKLKDLYLKLGKSILEHPDEYYRFYDECRKKTQKLISILAFVHWMETGRLLDKSTTDEKMGFEPPEFDLDLEDYLIGLCMMSNELTKYASNLYLSGEHDSVRNIAAFMINMEETLGVLFLSNDKLHERLEGLKHNVKRVQDMSVAGFQRNE